MTELHNPKKIPTRQAIQHHQTRGAAVVPVSAVHVGTRLICDGGFTCMGDGAVKEVMISGSTLFVRCRHGEHALGGQLDDAGENYLGFWLADGEGA